jgi:hypothetical protein
VTVHELIADAAAGLPTEDTGPGPRAHVVRADAAVPDGALVPDAPIGSRCLLVIEAPLPQVPLRAWARTLASRGYQVLEVRVDVEPVTTNVVLVALRTDVPVAAASALPGIGVGLGLTDGQEVLRLASLGAVLELELTATAAAIVAEQQGELDELRARAEEAEMEARSGERARRLLDAYRESRTYRLTVGASRAARRLLPGRAPS